MWRAWTRADDASRTYLDLQMRPLTAGALEPRRQQGGHRIADLIIVVTLAVTLVVVAPVVYFLSIFGDPFGLGFVERRPDGLYAQLRACDGDAIHRVEVAPYDEHTEQPGPFWVATSSGPSGATSVKLFSEQPEFDTSTSDVEKPTVYEVTINKGYLSESSVVVSELGLDVGNVEFGGEPVSRAGYDAMSNSDFGCPS